MCEYLVIAQSTKYEEMTHTEVRSVYLGSDRQDILSHCSSLGFFFLFIPGEY